MKEDKTCKICGKTFTRRNYMQKHMVNIHSKRYSCPKCFRFFSGPTEHSCANENGRFHCYVRDCSLRFSSGMAMKLHIRDCHQKLEEAAIEEVMKTKKGVRELVQTLCKKINLLCSCFNELKYQVDSIAVFLEGRNIGFEYKMPESTKISTSKKEKDKNKINTIVPEIPSEDYEDVDYIDEELELKEELEIVDEFPDENSMILDETIEYIPADAKDSEDKHSFKASTNENSQSYLITSDSDNFIVTTAVSKSSPERIINEPLHIVPMPKKTKIGSTIITQIPAHLVHHPKLTEPHTTVKETQSMTTTSGLNSKITKQKAPKRKATSTVTKSETIDSSTPPLFLKIQYDTETTVCETDPKITFHFDTKPPDLVQ